MIQYVKNSGTNDGLVNIVNPNDDEWFILIGVQPILRPGWPDITTFGVVASNGCGGLDEVDPTADALLHALAKMLGYKVSKIDELSTDEK